MCGKMLMHRFGKHKCRQAEECMADGSAWNSNNVVFTITNGQPVDQNNLVKRDFLRIPNTAMLGERVGDDEKKTFVPRIRLYDVRHSCATLLLAVGENPKVVSERPAHASIVMTHETYSHVLPTTQEAAAERLDSILYNSVSVRSGAS